MNVRLSEKTDLILDRFELCNGYVHHNDINSDRNHYRKRVYNDNFWPPFFNDVVII